MNRLFCLYPIFSLCWLGAGACVGSFLNVVIYRFPAEKSVITPGSTAPRGADRGYDQHPDLSWFILCGRARCCGKPYSFAISVGRAAPGELFVACWAVSVSTQPRNSLSAWDS